ncbi:hypothetical protein [Microbacterium sp. NPDC058389]|uniref:hypothetical protein n=1 Tax=Microbacterium sp. NPDC058389 TaxID=3346475 RepID=UPI0036597C4F
MTNTDVADEKRMLAALGLMGGRTWQEVRERMSHMSDREFASVARRLAAKGAIKREGRGADARLTRDMEAWHR